jgi:hypothetical protein
MASTIEKAAKGNPKLLTLLNTIEAYAYLAAGWTPSEEDDYDDFVEAIEGLVS